MLTELQKQIIEATISSWLEAICDYENIPHWIAKKGLEAIINDGILDSLVYGEDVGGEENCTYKELFIKYDILDCITAVRKILAHPSPQNRRNTGINFRREVSYKLPPLDKQIELFMSR